jgi:hypothetical protein
LKKLKAGMSLADLQKHYALFTYAPLFLYGGLEHNPIQEWLNLFKHGEVVAIMQLPAPVVQLSPPGDHKLDSVLWAVQLPYWSKLAMHIGSIGLMDRGRKRFTRVVCQEVPIADVAALDNIVLANTFPTVTIVTFGVDSTAGCIVFEPAGNLIVERPTLRAMPPREATLKLGRAIFHEHEDPYAGVNDANSNPSTP